jgi:hypothetical protein
MPTTSALTEEATVFQQPLAPVGGSLSLSALFAALPLAELVADGPPLGVVA